MTIFHPERRSTKVNVPVCRPVRASLLASIFGLMPVAAISAQIALPDPIERRSLTANAFETGTLSPREGALSQTLWQGADGATLSFLLDQVPVRPALPAIGQTVRRVLLTPGTGPNGLDPAAVVDLGGRKLLALVNAGFIEEARTIASLSDAPRNDPATGKALALADLLTRRENDACARGANIATARDDPFWVKLRTFCYTLAGERDAADLTYGLLRDRGLLTQRDEMFLGAVVLGVVQGKPLQPQTALELAIARQMNQAFNVGVSRDTDGSVVKALALDPALDAVSRIYAARTGVAMGIMSAEAFGSILMQVELSPELAGELAGAASAMLRQQPANPMTDAIVFQAVQQMSAPEFLRDKAALIAQALSVASAPGIGFDQQFATHLLYANHVEKLEGALIPPADAAQFARARLAAGDGPGAGRWLFAMKGDESVTALGDGLAQLFFDLTGYLSLLDPVTAKIVADSADIEIIDPITESFAPAAVAGSASPIAAQNDARIVEAVFDSVTPDAGATNKPGQAALSALAMASQSNLSPIQIVVLEQAISIAGLQDMKAQLRLQTAWQAISKTTNDPTAYRSQDVNPVGSGVQSASQTRSSQDDDRLSPRVKPRSRA